MSEVMYKEFEQCPICGDPLVKKRNDDTVLICECCGFNINTTRSISEIDKERLREANEALKLYEFEKAEEKYNLILEDNPQNSEIYLSALFGKLLSTFGIVYIKDTNGEMIPTFTEYNPSIKSILNTDTYQKISSVDLPKEVKTPYLEKIQVLDKVYRRIDKEIKEKDEYDLFICTKISRKTLLDPNADGLTSDSKYAEKFFNYFKSKGLKVFYSEACCDEIEYDSQILSALLKSKKMLVISTRKDYLESSWVQSEWRRWINFINCKAKEKNSLILFFPNYDVNAFELPRILRKTQRYTSELDIINILLKEDSPKEEIALTLDETKKEASNFMDELIEAKKIEEEIKRNKDISMIAPQIKNPKEEKEDPFEKELINQKRNKQIKKEAEARKAYERKEYSKAIKLFEEILPETSDYFYYSALAEMYYLGLGKAKDLQKALELYAAMDKFHILGVKDKINLASIYYEIDKYKYKPRILDLLGNEKNLPTKAKSIYQEVSKLNTIKTKKEENKTSDVNKQLNQIKKETGKVTNKYNSYAKHSNIGRNIKPKKKKIKDLILFFASIALLIGLAFLFVIFFDWKVLSISIPGALFIITILYGFLDPFENHFGKYDDTRWFVHTITSALIVLAYTIYFSIVWIWWLAVGIGFCILLFYSGFWLKHIYDYKTQNLLGDIVIYLGVAIILITAIYLFITTKWWIGLITLVVEAIVFTIVFTISHWKVLQN